METFTRQGTRNTPQLSFDPGTGQFEISGRSFMQDPFDFYEDLFLWLEKYVEVPLKKTVLSINSDYFNTVSYKCYLEIIKKLEMIGNSTHDVDVIWYYEDGDDECREAGEDLMDMTMLTIKVERIKL
jgi:hypothetical protein